VIKPDPDTGISITVEISRGKNGTGLLEETMKGLNEFLRKNKQLCNIVLDEFQEITELKESGAIEGIIRSYIQRQQNVSYFFVGSRRRILLDIFNNSKRPFYRSSLNFVLPPLPENATVQYIMREFKKNGKECPEKIAEEISRYSDGYPYYIQKLCYYIFDEAKNKVNEKILHRAVSQLLYEETPLYEMTLQNLRSGQRAFLYSLARETTKTPFTTRQVCVGQSKVAKAEK